jgi:hypothetical protein
MKGHLEIRAFEYNSRVAAILLAAISPFICLIAYGYLPSLSSYWNTDLQPLFIIANAITSYYLYSIKPWRMPALMLLFLTAFSVELFPMVHNALAVGFFIMNLYPLYNTNHFKWCIYIYLLSLLVLPWSMTFAEIISIGALCIYHYLLLRKVYKLNK